jgi:hypothetical protein
MILGGKLNFDLKNVPTKANNFFVTTQYFYIIVPFMLNMRVSFRNKFVFVGIREIKKLDVTFRKQR